MTKSERMDGLFVLKPHPKQWYCRSFLYTLTKWTTQVAYFFKICLDFGLGEFFYSEKVMGFGGGCSINCPINSETLRPSMIFWLLHETPGALGANPKTSKSLSQDLWKLLMDFS